VKRALAGLLCLAALSSCRSEKQVEPIVVFNAGSLAAPLRELLLQFSASHPGTAPVQESSGSLEAARKLTELGRIPDVLAVADYNVIAKLLMPAHATWYATFASNAMVLAYTDQSAGASLITGSNWWQILLRPGVRWGSSDPALDPNGYRAQMVSQLAEEYYREPGLAARLAHALQARFIRPSEAQLVALLQAHELDYAWSYKSIAVSAGLRWLQLPPEIDLSDPGLADRYSKARVRLPGQRLAASDSVEFRGEPIVYALTIPEHAPHPALARALVRFVLSDSGRAILRRSGFVALDKPVWFGSPPPLDR